MLAHGTVGGNGAPGARAAAPDRPALAGPPALLPRLRSLGAARALLLCAIIALVSHFIADSGLWRAAKTSRFDFSGAICSTGKDAKPVAGSALSPVKPAPAPHHHAGGNCCDLCCGAGAAPLAGTPTLAVPPPAVGKASPIAVQLGFNAAPQWAPQAARAPPLRF